uniref:Uncharacterized protein n=1 Tax=Romanomermis culicivorax TaxID=13658 RepID=A0A915KPZ2_ROMCU
MSDISGYRNQKNSGYRNQEKNSAAYYWESAQGNGAEECRSSVASQPQPLSCSRASLKSLVNSAVSRGDPALDSEQSSGISDL